MAVKIDGGFSGKVRLFDRMIAFNWKGLQVFRSETPKIHQTKSDARELVNALFPKLVSRWFTILTPEQRWAWDQYASTLNSEAREVSDRMGNGAKNIIPSRKKLMSGFNAYIRSNLLAATRAAPIPRDTAPLAVPAPMPPMNVTVTYSMGIAEVSWSDPDVSMYPPDAEVYVSIWAMIQKKKRVHAQLIAAYPVPTPGSMTWVNIKTGHTWNSPVLPLEKFKKGMLAVQMDTVTSGNVPPNDVGFIPSPPSQVATTIIS